MCKQIDQFAINLSVLSKLSESYDPKLLIITRPDRVELDDTIKLIINSNNSFYDFPKREILIINTFVKTQLILNSISNYLVNIYPPYDTVSNVLIIDCGEGDDIRTYTSSPHSSVRNIVLTDVNSYLLDTAEVMASKMKVKHTAKQASMIDNDYGNDMKKIMPKVDIIDWQFAIQYSWHCDYYNIIINNLKIISKFGTKLIITCNDGDLLRQRLKLGPIVIKDIITMEYIDDIKYRNNNLEEFYVSRKSLVESLEGVGFVVVSSDLLSNLLKANEYIFKHTKASYKQFNQMKIVYSKVLNDNLYDYYSFMRYYFLVRTTK